MIESMKRAAAFSVLVAAVTAACEQLTGVSDLRIGENTPPGRATGEPNPDLSDTGSGPQVDGAVTAPDATPDTAAPIDSGIDTTPAACTALPTNETFPAAIGAEWTRLGAAVAANPGVHLTPSTQGLAGALWWSNAATFDRFDITFSYSITPDAASTTYGPGDGMAFAWVSSATVPALGATGGALAIAGLTGFAVAIDAYANAEYADPATPNIAIKNTVDMTNIATTAANVALIDGNAHVIRVKLANGSLTVLLDGNEAIGATALPNYTAYSGFWGFGAGTGGAFELHELVNVTARIGTTGPCAAP
jgi:hypothetical protein